tara:strand:+ start:333 stop:476 length:144 start_codon:yes stop_codon:yes gene_type:complete
MDKILYCSWCNNDTFIPISSKLAKCENCKEMKAIDVEDEITGTIADD